MPLPNLLANKPFNYTGGSTTAARAAKEDLDYESSSAFRDHLKQKIHTSSTRRSTTNSYNRGGNELVSLEQRHSSRQQPIDLKLGADFAFASRSTYSRPSSRGSIRNSVDNFRSTEEHEQSGLIYTPRKSSGVVTRRHRIFYDNKNDSINNDEITSSTIINADDDDDDEVVERSRGSNRYADQQREKNVSRTSRNDESDYFEKTQTPRLKSGRLTSRQQDREDSFFREAPVVVDRSNSRTGNRRLASLEGGNYLNNSSLIAGFNKENKKNATATASARSTSPTKARRRLDDHDADDQLPTLSARDRFREPSSKLRTTLVERSTNYEGGEESPRRPNSGRLRSRDDFGFGNAKPQGRPVLEREETGVRMPAESPARKPVPTPRKHLTSVVGDEGRRKDSSSYDLFSKNALADDQRDQQPIIRGNSGGRRYQPTASAKSNRLLNLRQKNYDSNFN